MHFAQNKKLENKLLIGNKVSHKSAIDMLSPAADVWGLWWVGTAAGEAQLAQVH